MSAKLSSILLQNKLEDDRYAFLEPEYAIMLGQEFKKLSSCL